MCDWVEKGGSLVFVDCKSSSCEGSSAWVAAQPDDDDD